MVIFSIKNYIVVTDVVIDITYFRKSVNTRVVITLVITWRYPLENSEVMIKSVLTTHVLINILAGMRNVIDDVRIFNNVNIHYKIKSFFVYNLIYKILEISIFLCG